MGRVSRYSQSHPGRETALLDMGFQVWASGKENRIPVIPEGMASKSMLNPSVGCCAGKYHYHLRQAMGMVAGGEKGMVNDEHSHCYNGEPPK